MTQNAIPAKKMDICAEKEAWLAALSIYEGGSASCVRSLHKRPRRTVAALNNTKNMEGPQTEALVTLGTATAKKPVNATLVNSNEAGFGSSGFFSSDDVLLPVADPCCPADELDDVLPAAGPCCPAAAGPCRFLTSLL